MFVLCHKSLAALDLHDHHKLVSFLLTSGAKLALSTPLIKDDFFSSISLIDRRIAELWTNHWHGEKHYCQFNKIEAEPRSFLSKLPSLDNVAVEITSEEPWIGIFVDGSWFNKYIYPQGLKKKGPFWVSETYSHTEINLYGGRSWPEIHCDRILPTALFEEKQFEPYRREDETKNEIFQLAREFGELNSEIIIVNRWLISRICKCLLKMNSSKNMNPDKIDTTFPFKLIRSFVKGSRVRTLKIVAAEWNSDFHNGIEASFYNAVLESLQSKLVALIENGLVRQAEVYLVKSDAGPNWKNIWERCFIAGTNFDLFWHHFDEADHKDTGVRCDMSLRRSTAFNKKISTINSLEFNRRSCERWVHSKS